MNCVSITHISRLATQLTLCLYCPSGWPAGGRAGCWAGQVQGHHRGAGPDLRRDVRILKQRKLKRRHSTSSPILKWRRGYQDDQLYWAQTLTLTVVVLTKFGHRKCFAAFFLYKYSRADFYQSDRCSVVLFVDDGLWGAQAVKNVFPSSSQAATWAYKAAGVQKWFFATFKICCLFFLLCKKD